MHLHIHTALGYFQLSKVKLLKYGSSLSLSLSLSSLHNLKTKISASSKIKILLANFAIGLQIFAENLMGVGGAMSYNSQLMSFSLCTLLHSNKMVNVKYSSNIYRLITYSLLPSYKYSI
jgi:hypothetical protein